MKNPVPLKCLVKGLKHGLIETLCSGKVLFMLFAVVVILVGIWGNAMNIEWYNSAHGVQTLSNPRMEAMHLMIGVIAITGSIFIYCISKSVIKELNEVLKKGK